MPQQHHQNGQQQAMAQSEGIHTDVLNELTETDLNVSSTELLHNLLTKEAVLANLDEREVQEVVWDLRILENMYYWMHPPEESVVTGRVRAFVNDDASDTLEPLSDSERFEVFQLFKKLRMRVTRSRGMAQQEVVQTQIKEHRAKDDREESTGILGAISK